MEEIYDLAILGAGPAGICAAIYATRGKLNTLWLEKKFVQGGQIVDTYEVDNYPGLPGITGLDLGETMVKHAEKLGIKPKREPVLSIEEENGLKVIRTKKNRYMAKAVILACGAAHRQLGIPGEEELSGMGVSYCATCDGAFFQDGTVAVVGGGNVAVEDAILLSRTCKKVYLVHRRDELRADKVLQDKLFKCANVEMVWDSVPTVIEGTDKVEDIKVHNVKTDEGKTIAVDGVFIAVGILPNTEKFKGLVDLDESGYIIAGEDGVTSTPGIFAAGDIRTKNLRQVVTAVADGANAVASVQRYLIEK
ncbi:thioredoxin-disulfide reductase [Blautia sp. OM07-19]|jgi:thioredoxin reductase (NADPH)|uniref:thioredoxin-disulfide reductase n=1 Tax=Blautia sp. OM07-19 TaxID=2292985 RepID=UPI000E533AB1|nr:thioredoxin-disulfide reductase [Blautia sp. OM07-19]RHU99625.1 thioredoxin-disulfide reductase [Blautia sp. OM07-19]